MKTKIVLALALTTSIGFIAGCSSTQPLVEPYMEPMESDYQIDRVWQVKLDALPNRDTEGLFFAEDDKHVYIATETGHVSALIKGDQSRWADQTLWQIKFDSPVIAGPTLYKNKLFFGTSKGQLVAVAADTGAYLWQSQLSSEVISKPIIADNKVFTRTVDGKVYGINVENGKQVWVAENQVPSLSLRGSPETVYNNGVLYVGWESGTVQALSAKSGSLLWETRIAVPTGRTDLERIVDVQSKLVYFENRLFAMGYNGKLVSINPRSGEFYFVKDISGYRDFVVDGKKIYIVDDTDTLYAFDINNGVQIWKQMSMKDRLVGDLAESKDHLLVVDAWGYLHWFDKLQGIEVARAKHSNDYGDGNQIQRVMTEANAVYLLDEQGVITRYNVGLSDLKQFKMMYPEDEVVEPAEMTEKNQAEAMDKEDKSWWQKLWPFN